MTEKIIAKEIDDIITVLLTKDGKVYGCCDRRIVNREFIDIPFPVEGIPDEKRIISIRSSLGSCLALTDDGEIYEWETNLRKETASKIKNPKKLNRIVAIEKSGFAKYCLTAQGELYFWGLANVGSIKNHEYPKELAKA